MFNDNDEYLIGFSPEPIPFADFEKQLLKIKQEISKSNKIDCILDDYKNIPYYFKKNLESKNMPSIKDVASFYVLISYLVDENKQKFDRNEYYAEFFKEQWDEKKEFLYSVAAKEETDLFKDLEIDIVKGSIYKIKKYFLENNKIKDIRGASTILDYLNIEATINYLEEKYVKECSIYCGGGNVLLIVPKGEGQKVCKELEELYSKVSLTAKVAFEHITCKLNDLVRYSDIMRKLNEKLEERKKIKIYEINPDNNLEKIKIEGKEIYFKYEKISDKKVCKLCSVRDAKYKAYTPEGEIPVCPSCLRKNTVGKDKERFYDEFCKYIKAKFKPDYNMKNRYKINSINDISDTRGYVAVIYADGNNMGNVVKNIKTPFAHMYFSRKLDENTKKSVYESIYEIMGEDAKFEAIALGGDEVFLIVPADVSLALIAKIIEKFDKASNYKLTISAGICIAKYNTPLQNMFDISLQSLKNAKKYARKTGKNEGTVDVVVIEGSSYFSLGDKRTSLFPMTCSRLFKVLEIVNKMKKDKDIKKNQIYKLKYAANNMDSINEFQLFYLYQQARNSPKYTEYVSQIFDIEDGYFSGLIKLKDYRTGEKIFISPWDDIALLMNYTGGVESEPS
ncbi:Cas10/Cmr2 second palm domain-containing protein [Caloranaerobacter sp. DY30410]|uniref:Cas10/Cmr2 second palm domain-containing protein n=1 Tax=Caloranaerobacter sp. DY30410 TaxID=3238305 RepID=UPI003D07519A